MQEVAWLLSLPVDTINEAPSLGALRKRILPPSQELPASAGEEQLGSCLLDLAFVPRGVSVHRSVSLLVFCCVASQAASRCKPLQAAASCCKPLQALQGAGCGIFGSNSSPQLNERRSRYAGMLGQGSAVVLPIRGAARCAEISPVSRRMPWSSWRPCSTHAHAGQRRPKLKAFLSTLTLGWSGPGVITCFSLYLCQRTDCIANTCVLA